MTKKSDNPNPKKIKISEARDKHEQRQHHQMDTNGFVGHPQLVEHAEKRFLATALAYCQHIEDGSHESCTETCQIHLGLIDAYRLLMSL